MLRISQSRLHAFISLSDRPPTYRPRPFNLSILSYTFCLSYTSIQPSSLSVCLSVCLRSVLLYRRNTIAPLPSLRLGLHYSRHAVANWRSADVGFCGLIFHRSVHTQNGSVWGNVTKRCPSSRWAGISPRLLSFPPMRHRSPTAAERLLRKNRVSAVALTGMLCRSARQLSK
jgi:hypothetical protein